MHTGTHNHHNHNVSSHNNNAHHSAAMNITPSASGTTSPVHIVSDTHGDSLSPMTAIDVNKDVNEVWLEMNHLLKKISSKSSSPPLPSASADETMAVTVEGVSASSTDDCHSLHSHGLEHAMSVKHAQEVTRYAGDEYHNISAVIGGIGSQEIVKLLTSQYICINHTVVYNGICGLVSIYEL